MKFLAFTDLHEDKDALKALVARAKQDDVEFMVCTGDISTFGRGLKNFLKEFNKVGKKLYLVPGNHEEGMKFDEIIADYKNCVNLHQKDTIIGKYVFLGHGGGGFAQTDSEFRKLARRWYGKYNGDKIVLLTHMPPFNTKLDDLGDEKKPHHVGNIDYRKFIERIKPKLAISGHLHETFDMSDKIKRTRIVNPGVDGMVIELK